MNDFVKVERGEEYCEVCEASIKFASGELLEFIDIGGGRYVCDECVENMHDALRT